MHGDLPPLASIPAFSQDTEASFTHQDILDPQAEHLDPSQPVERFESHEYPGATTGPAVQPKELVPRQPTATARLSGRKPPVPGVGREWMFGPLQELPQGSEVNRDRRLFPVRTPPHQGKMVTVDVARPTDL